MGSDKRFTILEHLAELRSRLTKSVIAVIIATILSFIFADRIFQILVLKTIKFKATFILTFHCA
ncbi:MAG: twin-arginine translocase subunit TatC [Chloroflexota bacterium]|nr:twin-arginine translocase subunit TatC [Chloroflexota bacterium]